MSFFRNMFRTAGEIAVLSQQLAFYESENKKLAWRAEQLEKQVTKERDSKDKVMLRYCDQISVKNGLYGTFKEIAVEKTKVTEPAFTQAETEKIEYLAGEMRDSDIQMDIEPKSLETYIEAIKANPTRYLD